MRQKKNTDFLVFAMFTFLAVATWTGLGIYRAYTKAPAPKVTQAQLSNLDPKLDTEILSEIEARKQYAKFEINQLKSEKIESGSDSGEIVQ